MLLNRYSIPRSKQWANIPIIGYQLSECISPSYEDPCLRVNNTAPRVRANLFVGQKVCVKPSVNTRIWKPKEYVHAFGYPLVLVNARLYVSY
jgi:hypothetical protein